MEDHAYIFNDIHVPESPPAINYEYEPSENNDFVDATPPGTMTYLEDTHLNPTI